MDDHGFMYYMSVSYMTLDFNELIPRDSDIVQFEGSPAFSSASRFNVLDPEFPNSYQLILDAFKAQLFGPQRSYLPSGAFVSQRCQRKFMRQIADYIRPLFNGSRESELRRLMLVCVRFVARRHDEADEIEDSVLDANLENVWESMELDGGEEDEEVEAYEDIWESMEVNLNQPESVTDTESLEESSDVMEMTIRESMEAYRIRFVGAERSSVMGLEKVRMEVGGLDGEQCVVCIEEFVEKEEVSRMPCKHVFHGDCIVRWLLTSHVCPICRYAMPIAGSH